MKRADKTASVNADCLNLTSIFLKTILKTTVCVFVPTLALFGVGALIDVNFDTKPIAMLTGVSVGFAIAILLVVFQISKIRKGKK